MKRRPTIALILTLLVLAAFPLLAASDATGSHPSPVAEFIDLFTKLAGWLIATGLAIWMKLSKTSRERTVGIIDQPVRTKEEQEVATDGDLRDHREQVERRLIRIEAQIEKKFTDLDTKRHNSISALHTHINVIETRMRREVKEASDEMKRDVEKLESTIEERLKQGNSRMTEHDKAIERLDERTQGNGKGRQPR